MMTSESGLRFEPPCSRPTPTSCIRLLYSL